MSEVKTGDPHFHFVVEIENGDLVVNNVVGTWFGGPNDPSDSGRTASGVSTRDHPNLIGCALPMDRCHSIETDGSPIPKLPWNTFIRVTNRANGRAASIPLIDLGPSKFAPSHAAIDLTEEAFKLLGGRPQDGIMRVDFVVPGGARYLHGGRLNGEPRSVSLGRPSAQAAETRAAALHPQDGHGHEVTADKPAIKAFIQSPHRSSRNGTSIDMIVLHCTTSSNVSGTINWLLNSNPQVSAHYIIDRNGDIYQMVADSECAWHAKSANRRSIGVEHVGTAADQLSNEQSAASANLIRWLATAYEVPFANIMGHKFAPGNVGTTSCPDRLFGPTTAEAITEWVQENVAAV